MDNKQSDTLQLFTRFERELNIAINGVHEKLTAMSKAERGLQQQIEKLHKDLETKQQERLKLVEMRDTHVKFTTHLKSVISATEFNVPMEEQQRLMMEIVLRLQALSTVVDQRSSTTTTTTAMNPITSVSTSVSTSVPSSVSAPFSLSKSSSILPLPMDPLSSVSTSTSTSTLAPIVSAAIVSAHGSQSTQGSQGSQGSQSSQSTLTTQGSQSTQSTPPSSVLIPPYSTSNPPPHVTHPVHPPKSSTPLPGFSTKATTTTNIVPPIRSLSLYPRGKGELFEREDIFKAITNRSSISLFDGLLGDDNAKVPPEAIEKFVSIRAAVHRAYDMWKPTQKDTFVLEALQPQKWKIIIRRSSGKTSKSGSRHMTWVLLISPNVAYFSNVSRLPRELVMFFRDPVGFAEVSENKLEEDYNRNTKTNTKENDDEEEEEESSGSDSNEEVEEKSSKDTKKKDKKTKKKRITGDELVSSQKKKRKVDSGDVADRAERAERAETEDDSESDDDEKRKKRRREEKEKKKKKTKRSLSVEQEQESESESDSGSHSEG